MWVCKDSFCHYDFVSAKVKFIGQSNGKQLLLSVEYRIAFVAKCNSVMDVHHIRIAYNLCTKYDALKLTKVQFWLLVEAGILIMLLVDIRACPILERKAFVLEQIARPTSLMIALLSDVEFNWPVLTTVVLLAAANQNAVLILATLLDIFILKKKKTSALIDICYFAVEEYLSMLKFDEWQNCFKLIAHLYLTSFINFKYNNPRNKPNVLVTKNYPHHLR